MAKVSSLAGTGRTYVQLQARVYRMKTDGRRELHIQGRGPEVNRDYGVAETVALEDKALRRWLKDVDASNESLAGTEAVYFELQARRYPGDVIHFQVRGTDDEGDTFNRSYGAMFELPVAAVPNIARFIDAA